MLVWSGPIMKAWSFFFNDTATTEIYTLSLHDALPISHLDHAGRWRRWPARHRPRLCRARADRKSTRLNSSHEWISYAVFCLKKKKGRGSGLLASRAQPQAPDRSRRRPRGIPEHAALQA